MTQLIRSVGALAPEAVLDLPGARRHCARVSADLRTGMTCVWLFPDVEVESGRADLAVETVAHGLDDVVDAPAERRGARPALRAALPEAHDLWSPPGSGGAGDGGTSEASFDVDDGFGDWSPSGARVGDAFRAASYPPAPGFVVGVPALDSPDADVTARLARSLGIDGDLVSGLVADPDGRAPVLVVRAWSEGDPWAVSRLIRRFQAAVKESGLKPDRRPRLLVASRPQDLEADGVGLLDTTVSRTHWWWSVWSHLDTATVVAAAVPHTNSGRVGDHMTPGKFIRHALHCETLVQSAGPDLALAVRLAEVWNGSLKDLPDALRECCPARVGQAVQGRLAAGAAYAPLPAHDLREAWSAGLVDSWEGQIRRSPRSGAELHRGPELDKLVWQAQNRVLLPLIDDARLSFVEMLPRIATRGTTRLVECYVRQSLRSANGSASDLTSMELGELYDAAVHRDIALTDDQFRRLRTLRRARNKLAHRTPVDDTLLRDLLDALSPL